MYKSTTADVKRERKKSLFLRELSVFVDTISQEQPALREVYLSRLELSADGGICYLYFAAIAPMSDAQPVSAEDRYKAALEVLKLYRPSIRKALAQALQARYTPDLIFMFDEKREQIDRINELLDQVQQELSSTPDEENMGGEAS
jgi:ribosome-binding factor A